MTPCKGRRPAVTFRPTTPQRAAGRRTDPPVSLPMPDGLMLAATATAVPDDEPPGIRWAFMSQGFIGVPSFWLVPQPPKAHSTVLVLPRIIPPAAFSRSTTVEVVPATLSNIAADPHVVTLPFT